jgi:hypothetical protein
MWENVFWRNVPRENVSRVNVVRDYMSSNECLPGMLLKIVFFGKYVLGQLCSADKSICGKFTLGKKFYVKNLQPDFIETIISLIFQGNHLINFNSRFFLHSKFSGFVCF